MKSIQLVRYRQWFIPVNVKSYKRLKRIGFPVTRIHEDSVPVLKLMLHKYAMTAKVHKWKDMLKKFYHSMKGVWQKAEHVDSRLSSERMIFFTLKKKDKEQGLKQARVIVEKSEKFFRRYGFTVQTDVADVRGIIKVTISFSWSNSRPPVIEFDHVGNTEKKILQMGNHRILTTKDPKFWYWYLEVKTGDLWKPVTSGKCLLEEVTDPLPLISSLMEVYN